MRQSAVIPLLAIFALSATASAQRIDLRVGDVIPVKFDHALTIKDNRPGDLFTATVDDDGRLLPRGSILDGQVLDVKAAKGKDPATMKLEFTDILMPDGSRIDIDAVPIPLTDKYVTRDADGRFTAKKSDDKSGAQVLGGAVAGFIIGSIIGGKQLEGTLIGGALGVLVAATDSSNDGNTIIASGQRMGALIQKRVSGTATDATPLIAPENQTQTQVPPITEQPPVQSEQNPPPARPARQNDKISVFYGNRQIYWDRDKPYWDGDVAMVPLDHTAVQMGIKVTRGRQDADAIVLSATRGELQVWIDADSAQLDNQAIRLDAPVRKSGDTVYVPLYLLVQIAREPVRLNGTNISDRR